MLMQLVNMEIRHYITPQCMVIDFQYSKRTTMSMFQIQFNSISIISHLKGEENVAKLLIESSANLNAKRNDGTTPLHQSILTGIQWNIQKLKSPE